MQRAQAGDLNAFETLISRYERRIWALAKQVLQHDQDAEDVVQDTFLTALEHLHTLREGERFGAWLKQIAVRLAYRVLAKRKRMPTESLDALLSEDPDEDETALPRPQLVADWRDSPEVLLQRKETMRLIKEALQQLPEKYRVVFWLRDVEQLSTRETAEVLGISEANVKVRLLRARLMLREYLTRLFGADAEQILTHND